MFKNTRQEDEDGKENTDKEYNMILKCTPFMDYLFMVKIGYHELISMP